MVMRRCWFFFFIITGICFFYSGLALAQQTEPEAEQQPDLQVIALFKNAAMVRFEGQQKMVRAGQKISPEIKLLSANTEFATFLVEGEKLEMGVGLGRAHNIQFEESKPAVATHESSDSKLKSTRIVRNIQGHFVTGGTINGIAVKFMVDTGATTVAMSEKHAQFIGLDYRMDGVKAYGSTAGGIVETWNLTLNRVSVGNVELSHVNATVIKGVGMDDILLGMSFLNRIKMEYEGPLLILSKKF